MPPCGLFTVDIGPILGGVLTSMVTVFTVYLGVQRIQGAIEGQQKAATAQSKATQGGPSGV